MTQTFLRQAFTWKPLEKFSRMYTIRNKVLFEYLEVVTVVAEITEAGAESEDLNMQVIENDKRLAALKAYAMTA